MWDRFRPASINYSKLRDFSIFSTVVCEKEFFPHTFVEKIEKSIHLLPVCKLYPTLLARLSHTASSVAYEG